MRPVTEVEIADIALQNVKPDVPKPPAWHSFVPSVRPSLCLIRKDSRKQSLSAHLGELDRLIRIFSTAWQRPPV